MRIEPSLIQAFLVGVSTLAPLGLAKYKPDGDSQIWAYALAFLGVTYLVAWLRFVHGPALWDRYRFVPEDGVGAALRRGIFWLCGVMFAASVAAII